MGREGPGWRHHFAPLGIATVVIADNPELLATAQAAYADWTAETPQAEPFLEIRLVAGRVPSSEVSCGIHVQGSRLTLGGNEIAGEADAATGRAQCSVPRRLIGEPGALAAEVTDTLLLFLLTHSGRTPIHSAGILVGNAALMLAGPSGSGKSTLALAAARRGLHVLSDDTLYVEREPSLRIWGFPRPIHVFPKDAPPGQHATRLRSGKLKTVVPLGAEAGPRFAERAIPILIERGDRLELSPLNPEKVADGLTRPEPGFDLLAGDIAVVAHVLAAGGGWRLTLSRDPWAAINLLCERFGSEPAR